jgi:hypothetical protein
MNNTKKSNVTKFRPTGKLPTGAKNIYNSIKAGTYPVIEDYDITQFYKHLGNGKYVPDYDKRLQDNIRSEDRNVLLVEQARNKLKRKIEEGIDYSQDLKVATIVYFPDTNEEKVLDKHHGTEIAVTSGLTTMPAYRINFKTQLNSSMYQLTRLGVLLNIVDVEEQGVTLAMLKKQILSCMKERLSKGMNPQPSNSEKDEWAEDYPGFTRNTIGQIISNISTEDIIAPRDKAKKNYTSAQLEEQRLEFADHTDYYDYAVTNPKTLDAWDGMAMVGVFRECAAEDKKKALVILYCSTMKQVEEIKKDDGAKKKHIQTVYDALGEYWGVQIETVFLAYE